jgi:uncharacterized membrane protein YjfL (UPF0719 family)
MSAESRVGRIRVNGWGIAGVVILIVAYFVEWYCHSLRLISRNGCYGVCFILQLTAVCCGIVAAKRGSAAWLVPVIISIWLMLVCVAGEL